MATTNGAEEEDKTAETGTYRWMSPEVIRHEPYTQTADVFSYGVVLWQLLTREVPFADKSQIEAAAAVALEGLRPPMPADVPKSILELIQQCWSQNATERPSFDRIVEKLEKMEKNVTEEEQEWLPMK